MKRALVFISLCVLLSGCIMDKWYSFKKYDITVDYQEQTALFELDEKKEILFYLSTAITDDSTFFAHENGKFNDYIIGDWFKIEKKGNDIFVSVSENNTETKRNLRIECTGALIPPVELHQLPK
ncbi:MULTISPECIES: hypothetical protein [unclassified Muribaculum]|uniref:Lipoprotein n=1 Tax=Candidatus Merdivivens faecigallinarum TaxID=2840871 RepID=A0A9D9NPL6_9BACT|nr:MULTISPECIES: hypothetical protein [unclassified Muribaculum]MBO8481115.1 hypothetical protein [Candidatus Merdivivens faecigallinarum]